ncbi:MAG: exodeoxyribonuclease VII large subunit [Bacteroidetes bacterium]|nr:exodeoxyribonuclease VII large subunit [Bacteroidota bacterium]
MSEKVNDRTIFSLSEVTLSIQRTLSERYNSVFWVKAEMNKVNRYPHSGHCYPDLVEKVNGKIIAEMRANIWKDDFDAINARFLEVLHEPLKDGINILFCAKITFHSVYGLSLRITDIDPVFSLGELEREKQETINRLKKEGILHANKSRILAPLPKRIAIISVQTSKGYADFTKVIGENPWGYQIFQMLFPALLQGENAVESILRQFAIIEKVSRHFDAVAIIRGGGGDIGLTCYNNYLLARRIALFPLPVITGIGHSTNETVAEMVAYKNAITPTELSDFLIQKFHNFSAPVNRALQIITENAILLIREEKLKTINLVRFFKTITGSQLGKNRHKLHQLTTSLFRQSSHFLQLTRERQIYQNLRILVKGSELFITGQSDLLELLRKKLPDNLSSFISREAQKVSQWEKMIEIMNPVHVLKRGYTITLVNNKVVKSAEVLKKGDQLKTILCDGEVVSIAQSITKINPNE